MIQITIPEGEAWNEFIQEFIYTKEQTIRLEHSLVSISKWESKWLKPFLSEKPKTKEELIDYIRCMCITQNVDPNSYYFLTRDNITKIKEYIDSPMSATTFSGENSHPKHKEIITSEIIYYQMVALNIPFECQKWHLNRLLTLIRICSIKNSPPKNMSKKDILKRNAALNQARRKPHIKK